MHPRTVAARGTPSRLPQVPAAITGPRPSEPTARELDDDGVTADGDDLETGTREPIVRERPSDDDPTTIHAVRLPTAPGGSSRPGSRRRGQVGKYELRDRLGRGGFGVVFTAHDPSLDRDVAVKVLRPTHLTNDAVVRRFLQEARATARIAHPGIVTIYDCGTVDTRQGVTAFIAMELLTGESLATRLERGPLDPVAAAELARQLASALAAAHRVEVLHRDLKPENIYLVPDPAVPSGERVKVLDFGLAKLGHDGGTKLQTVFGTPRYMSPEQCRSAAQVDARSDVYALGCILFELVTGHTPFDGEPASMIEHHQRAIAPRASSLCDLPAALDDLIAAMLAKAPDDRPPSMDAVEHALRDACVAAAPPPALARRSSPALAASSQPLPRPAPPARRTGELSGELIVQARDAPRDRRRSAVRPAPGASQPRIGTMLALGAVLVAAAVALAVLTTG